MESRYISVNSMQITPKDANIVSAHLFGFHCTSNQTDDYAESIAYHFLCARRTKENHDAQNKKYGEYGIEEYELEKYVRKKLLFKFVRKFYGKYKVKTVKMSHDSSYNAKNIYLRDDIFDEYKIKTLRTKISNEYRLLSQSLYEKIINNARSVFYSKQTQTAIKNILDKDLKWVVDDLNQDALDLITKNVYETFVKTIDWTNMYLPDGNTNFTIKPNSKMTMLEKNKHTYMSENGNWSTKNRTEIKYGKGLRRIMEFIKHTYIGDENKLLDIITSDTVIEQYVNKLKAIYNPNVTIEHVKGDDIRKWYFKGKYADTETGTLSRSCMRGSTQQKYFDIYTMNPDKIELLIALNDDRQLIGRALLWRLDYANGWGNTMFMDRIYGNDVIIEQFKKYAIKNKYWYKYEQTYNSIKMYTPDNTVQTAEFNIKLKNTDSELYPYMDTMQDASDVYQDVITLYSPNSNNGSYILTSTEGKWEDYTNDSDVYIERYGEYYHEDDVVYSYIYNEHIVNDDARITYDEEYVWYDDDDYVEAYDTESLHHIDDVEYSEYDGYYYYESTECEVHGTIGLSNSISIEINGNEYIVHQDLSEEEVIDALGLEIETNE